MPPSRLEKLDMPKSVKIADEVMAIVRRESSLQSRSLAGQITHWINIGRAVEQSSSFDYAHISAALQASRSPDRLTAEEQEVWAAEFAGALAEPSPGEETFFAMRRKLGRGVGMTDTGELIYQQDKS